MPVSRDGMHSGGRGGFVPALAGVYGVEDALRGDRHLRDVDAQRVKRVAYGGWDRREGGLAETLHLPAVAFDQLVGEDVGHVVHRGDVVVGEVGVGDLAL